jgi:GntR family transcriptional regulator
MPLVNHVTASQKARLHLLNLIVSSPQGSRLPGERELALDCKVARMTIRRAIDQLIQEQKLERRAGSGTFITYAPITHEFRLKSFTEEMTSLGLKPSSRILLFKYVKADSIKSSLLNVPIGSALLKCTRLRMADGVALGVETVYLPIAYFPGIKEVDLNGSLYELLKQRYGIQIINANTSFSASIPSQEVADQLDIQKNRACLELEMTDLDQNGRVIMLAECVYIGDQYKLNLFPNKESSESEIREKDVS